MVTVILVNQQVYRRFAEYPKTGWVIATTKGHRIDVAKRFGHKELVFCDQLVPCLNDIVLANNPVDPACFRYGFIGAIAKELYIERRQGN